MEFVNHSIEKLSSFFNPIRDRMNSAVPEFLTDQAKSIDNMFIYESFLEDEYKNILLMTDGSVGLCWKINLIEHETYNDVTLNESISRFTRIFESVSNDRACFQIIWDSYPDKDFELPEYFNNQNQTIAQKIMSERILKLKDLADNPGQCLKSMRRDLVLTFKLQSSKNLDSYKLKTKLEDDINEVSNNLDMLLNEFKKCYESIEIAMKTGGYHFKQMERQEFLEFVRVPFHTYEFKKNNQSFYTEYDENESLSNQILKDYVSMTPRYIEVGEEDTWEVLSWSGLSKNQYAGMMAHLLRIDIPLRVVVNIVPCKEKDEKSLDGKETLLENAKSSKLLKQKKEVRDTQNRIAEGEKLLRVSHHIFIRNMNTKIHDMNRVNSVTTIVNMIKNYIGIPYVPEKYAAPAIFLLCQPLAYSNCSGIFTCRERRIMSMSATYYLPIYGGFSGHQQKSQLMQSRNGTPIWLAPRENPDSGHHIATLAGTGSGKSYAMVNLIMSEVALNPDTLVFGLDYECSYEYLGKILAQDNKYLVCKPPLNFPNIFLGEMDQERIKMIVDIIITAIKLCDANFHIQPEFKMILQLSMEKVFHSKRTDASTRYDFDSNSFEVLEEDEFKNQTYDVPNLSDIVKKFGIVCTEQNYPSEWAQVLSNKLSPFYGAGFLSHIFDQKVTSKIVDDSPQFMFFDLSGVKSDNELLCPLTVIICLSEILRNIKKKENSSKPGIIVIDELGVIGKIPAVADFIQDAWTTFRKLRQMCIGITNDVEHYQKLPACRTVWNISPNKYILQLPSEQINKAVTDTPVLFSQDVGNVVSSLKKVDGAFSQGLIMTDHGSGTFIYVPTGFDHWLSVSRAMEKNTLQKILDLVGDFPKNYFKALKALSFVAPYGFRDKISNKCRDINEEEIKRVMEIYHEL